VTVRDLIRDRGVRYRGWHPQFGDLALFTPIEPDSNFEVPGGVVEQIVLDEQGPAVRALHSNDGPDRPGLDQTGRAQAERFPFTRVGHHSMSPGIAVVIGDIHPGLAARRDQVLAMLGSRQTTNTAGLRIDLDPDPAIVQDELVVL
jgi:hypothetical protein